MGHDGHHHHEHGEHESHTVKEHRHRSPVSVSTFVVTCSDSRDAQSDQTGRLIVSFLESHGHALAGHRIVRDEPQALEDALSEAERLGARAVIFNGGTGIGRRDVTYETLSRLFEKSLPGFGEIFRQLSFKEIGSAALFSRATAGTIRGMVVFSLPGSPNAAKLAMQALILPELGHAAMELVR